MESEENIKKDKIGGNSFKFSNSPVKPQSIPKVMPQDKKKAEFALTMLFTQLLLFKGDTITKIELNENDKDKGADTFIKINGIEKGIQITKLVFNDLLKRKDVGYKKAIKIAELVSRNLEIDFKVNVYIYPRKPYGNEIPINRSKLDNELANKIRNEIIANRDQLKNSSKPVFISFDDVSLNKIASQITLNPIPKNHYPLFPGKDNVFVNYEFDTNFFSYEEAVNEIKTLYNRKNRGKSEILLIWADRYEMLYQVDNIFNLIEKQFAKSTFEEVYFLTFFDRMDLYSESINLSRIKKHSG